ncbi:HutD family protein [Streptomyces sp. NPDC048643]|uniref:HutD/Ves family protein n=1 Tax=Streptomyces sp. NPDC048643 TaxID=3155637 RepID=UPI003422F38F
MSVHLMPAAGRSAVPWKNGGGVTREIVVHPEGADMSGFAWRVSLADVGADGPFSSFAGVDRILTMVEGAGMDLTVGDERRLVDTRYVPRRFPGDLPTGCRLLGGPVVNLNVMWNRGGSAVPGVEVLFPVNGVSVGAGPSVLVVALGDSARLAGLSLGRYDAALLAAEPATLRGTGPVAVIRVGP